MRCMQTQEPHDTNAQNVIYSFLHSPEAQLRRWTCNHSWPIKPASDWATKRQETYLLWQLFFNHIKYLEAYRFSTWFLHVVLRKWDGGSIALQVWRRACSSKMFDKTSGSVWRKRSRQGSSCLWSNWSIYCCKKIYAQIYLPVRRCALYSSSVRWDLGIVRFVSLRCIM